jgi:hypothetical protein
MSNGRTVVGGGTKVQVLSAPLAQGPREGIWVSSVTGNGTERGKEVVT